MVWFPLPLLPHKLGLVTLPSHKRGLVAGTGLLGVRLHVNLPRVPELRQTQVQELGPPRPDLLPLLDQSEVSTRSPPITAHLVLGEGGWELQPPGRYPGRGGRLLPGEPSASVAAKLGQPAPRHHQDHQVEHQPQPCIIYYNKYTMQSIV